jgi:MFS superfamily sulfate permease-like transporter
VVVSVLAFSNVISAFPNAALGGLVIYAAIRLIDVAEFRRLWSFRRREFLLAIAATAGVLLFNILYGVLAAVAISVVELLTRVARPHSAVLGRSEEVAGWHDLDDYPSASQIPGLVIFRYDSPLFFANAEDFYDRCRAAIETSDPPARWFVVNMEAITEVDITGLDALDEVRAYCESAGIVPALDHVKREVLLMLDRHGVGERIGHDRMFPTHPTAVAAYEEWVLHH